MAYGKKVLHSDIAPFVDGVQIKRAQEFGHGVDLRSNPIQEIANTGVVQYIYDTPVVPFNLTVYETDVVWELHKAMFNKASDATQIKFPDDFIGALPCVDFAVPVRVDGTYDHTFWLSRCFVERFAIDFSNNDMIRTTYSGNGDLLVASLNAHKDGKVAVGTYVSASAFTVPVDISTGYALIYARVNETLVPGSALTAGTYSGGKTTITVASPYNVLAASDRIRLFYCKTSAGTFPALTTSAAIGGLRRACADVYLKPYGGSYGKWFRLQRLGLDVPLGTGEITEIGTKYPIDKSLNLPFNFNISVTATRNNLIDLAIFAGKDPATVTEISVEDLVNNISNKADLKIEVYKSETDHSSSNFIERFTITNVTVTNLDARGAVGNAPLDITWTLQADNLTITNSYS